MRLELIGIGIRLMGQQSQFLPPLFDILLNGGLKLARMRCIDRHIGLLIQDELCVILKMAFHAEGSVEILEFSQYLVVGLGLVHVQLVIDRSVNIIECLNELKELFEVNFLLGLADLPEHLIDRFLIQHLVVLGLVSLDFCRIQNACAIGERHELAQRHGIRLMGDLVKSGIRPTGIQLLLTVELKHYLRLLLQCLVLLLFLFCSIRRRELVVLLRRLHWLCDGLLALLADVRIVG